MTGDSTDLGRAWSEGETFDRFLARAVAQRALWEGVYRVASIPDWARSAFAAAAPLRVLVLNADWCLDSANTVPVIARLAEAVPGVDLRLLERDDYLAIMDRYLTEGTRSIPLAILMDTECRELGRWGPRPAELQAWVLAQRERLPKTEQYREQRRWYARDRGETTLREMLGALPGN